jgi:hypothetical protein
MKTLSAGIGDRRRQVINPDFSVQWDEVYRPFVSTRNAGPLYVIGSPRD